MMTDWIDLAHERLVIIERLKFSLENLIDASHRAAWVSPTQMPHRHDDLVHAISAARKELKI
jgi:hypothetical protein